MEQGSVLRPSKAIAQSLVSEVSIPLEQGSVLRLINNEGIDWVDLSQSLWNRAVSYDYTVSSMMICSLTVSIPLEQGSVLRPKSLALMDQLAESLNPFGTGQCLTTIFEWDY